MESKEIKKNYLSNFFKCFYCFTFAYMTARTKKVNSVIGANIRFERRNEGLTQEQLAKKLKVSRISVVNLEQGRQGLTMLNLISLSKILNVSIERLVKGL